MRQRATSLRSIRFGSGSRRRQDRQQDAGEDVHGQHGFDGDAAPAPASSPRGPRAGSRPPPLVRGALAFRAFVRDGFEGGLERGQGRQQHAELLIESGGQQAALGFGGQQAFAFLGGKPVRRLRGTGAGEGSDFLAQDGVAVGAGPESGSESGSA